MDSKEHEKDNFTVALTGNSTISQPLKVIYIVGLVRCYNSLLASFLESEIGAKCQVFESLDKIPKRYPEDTGEINLVL